MKLLIATAAMLFTLAHCIEEDHRATSYQKLHIEHFHPVPLHAKKEFQHLIDHPISIGETESKIEIHHGGKHDHGYAFAHSHSTVHQDGGHLHGAGSSDEGHQQYAAAVQEQQFENNEAEQQDAYQNIDLSQYQELAQAALQAQHQYGGEAAAGGHYEAEHDSR